jgi:putative MATE family efflux protein
MDTFKNNHFQEGPVEKTLLKLTMQMFFGLVSLFAFNLVDLYFVGKLGTEQLAALSYSFPVIIFVANIMLGIGVGASAVVSRAFGEKSREKLVEITTNMVCFSVLFSGVLTIAGNFTMKPLFGLLGAGPEMISLITEYMSVWYCGMVFFVLPMVGNNIIRAMGDVKITSMIMFSGVIVNAALDPLLIFGMGPFPALGLKGAAVATVLSRMGACVVSLWVLTHRKKLVSFTRGVLKRFFVSLKTVLYLGMVNAGARIIIPVAVSIVTRLLSGYGSDAVAALGIGTRVEAMAMTVVFSMASVIGPFIGQNCGAGIGERVKRAVNYSDKFSFLWGAGVFFFFLFFSDFIAGIFNSSPEIVDLAGMYLRIVSLGYGLHGILVISEAALIVMHRPWVSFFMAIIEIFILYIPLVFLGNKVWGIRGIYAGISVSYIIAGLFARRTLASLLDGSGPWKGENGFCEIRG